MAKLHNEGVMYRKQDPAPFSLLKMAGLVTINHFLDHFQIIIGWVLDVISFTDVHLFLNWWLPKIMMYILKLYVGGEIVVWKNEENK